MSTVYFLKGLPASGKTTWAEELLRADLCKTFHVTKDKIRLENPEWSEKQVVAEETRRVRYWLSLPHENRIIIDNTHFNPVHEERYRKLAEEFGADFKVVDDFLQVPLEECIRRDNQRANGVGESVIKEMWRKYIRGENPPAHPITPKHPWCLIVDIDGTLADHRGNRSVHDYSRVGGDKIREHVWTVVLRLECSVGKVFYLSGRPESTRKDTMRWLRQAGLFMYGDQLILRPEGDTRKDYIYKKEVWEKQIQPQGYTPLAIFEDRPRNIRMWQSLGLPVFGCNEDYDDDF